MTSNVLTSHLNVYNNKRLKIKVTAFVGKNHIKPKFIINGTTIEQVLYFQYIGCNITHDNRYIDNNGYIEIMKLPKSQYVFYTKDLT